MTEQVRTDPLDPPEIEIDPLARRASRQKLILIFGVFFIPLLLATLWLQVVRSGDGHWGDTSRGELIEPAVPFEPFTLSVSGQPYTLDDLRGSWTLLYVVQEACSEQCRKNLYHMRQIRLALNHRMDRVDRAVVTLDPDWLDEELLTEHAGLQVLSGDAAAVGQFQAQIRQAQQAMSEPVEPIYLVDPLGNLMMRWSPEVDPGDILKDLKHLLKVSRIG